MIKAKKAQGMIAAIIVIALVVIGGIYLYSKSASSDTGRVVFAITDAAADIESVSAIKVTVSEIQAHKQGGGWITITSEDKTYDLLALKQSGELKVIADEQVAMGTYDQIRLDISNIVVVNSSGEQEAKLPSNVLKIDADMI